LEYWLQLTLDEQLTYLVAQGKQVNLLTVDLAQAKRFWQVFKTNTKASQCNQFQLYHDPIILFQSTKRSDELIYDDV
jgi:hypothetical protein